MTRIRYIWRRLSWANGSTSETINPKDGAELVSVPGGMFTMGTEYGAWWDAPQTQQVTLSGYSIYKYEVTVAQYRAFCTATSHALRGFLPQCIVGWEKPAGMTRLCRSIR